MPTFLGRVAEWFKAPVLKTDVPQGTVSSNLTPSAIYIMETMLSYSIDVLKKSAFQDELTNVLELLPEEQVDRATLDVIEYLRRRIKEIDKRTKS